MTTALAPPITDRRIARRHQAAFGTVCRFGREIGLVQNISQTGINMLLGNPPGLGTKVNAVLAMDGETTGMAVSIQVLHVREVSTGDYHVGGRFGNDLSVDDMEPFVSSDANDERPIPRKG